MEQPNREELRRKLEEKKANIIAKLENIGHRAEGEETNYDADFPSYGESEEDNATEMADYTANLSLEKQLEQDLKNINEAVKRLDENNYGHCEECGKDIEAEVLDIMPESRFCISCKQKKK